MNNKWKPIGVLIGQLIFSVLFFVYFTNNSFLRPSVDAKLENCIALMLVFAMFANFWILHLLLRRKGTIFLYLFFSAMEIVAAALVEYILTIEVNLSIYPNELLAAQGLHIKQRFFVNLLLRNCGLLSFVGLISDNIRLRVQIQDKERQLYGEKHQIEVQQIPDKTTVLLSEHEICYVIQNQNYNTFVTACGAKYVKRGTLNNLQDLLGEKDYVRISRSVIVRLKYIKSVKDNTIELLVDDNVEEYLLPISNSYLSTALKSIDEFLKKEQDIKETENAKVQSDSIHASLSPKAQNIRHYIAVHPNCKLSNIVNGTHIPKSTVTRYLKKMQEEDLIEYVGSKRTGGYRVVES